MSTSILQILNTIVFLLCFNGFRDSPPAINTLLISTESTADTTKKKPPVWKIIDKEIIIKHLPDSLVSRHYVVHFSKTLHSVDSLFSVLPKYDAYCDSVVRMLDLPIPTYTIAVYLYSNEDEKYELMGWQGGAQAFPPHDIHTMDLSILPHESAHVLFNNENRYWGSPSFLNEGVATYVENKLSPDLLKARELVMKNYLDQPLEDWITGVVPFFEASVYDGRPATYVAAGLFVGQLIKQFGLARYKQFHKKILLETSPADFKKIFHSTFDIELQVFLEQWKQIIRQY